MVDLVFGPFGQKDNEAIADVPCAWNSLETHRSSLLALYVGHLVKLADQNEEFPSRLRRAIIRTITLAQFQVFDQAGIEGFIGLLDRLEVKVDDIGDATDSWARLILEVIVSEVGRERLPFRY